MPKSRSLWGLGALQVALLATIMILCIASVNAGSILEWGDSEYLGTGVTRNWVGAAVPPTVLKSTLLGNPVPDFTQLAYNNRYVFGLTASSDLWVWGVYGDETANTPNYIGRAPRKLTLYSWPFSASNPVQKIFAAGNTGFVLDKNNVTWSFGLAHSPPGSLLGRPGYGDTEGLFNDIDAIKTTSYVNIAFSMIRCHFQLCVGLKGTDFWVWGPMAQSIFGVSDNTTPTNITPLGGGIPDGMTVHDIAVCETGFFMTASNATTPVRIYTSATTGSPAFFLSSSDPQGASAIMWPSDHHDTLGGQMPNFIAAGMNFGLAAFSDKVFTWGDNLYAQLGVPSTSISSSSSMVQVSNIPGGTVITGASASDATAFILTSTGSIYFWGRSGLCSKSSCLPNSMGWSGAYTDMPSGAGVFPTLMQLPAGFQATTLPTPRNLDTMVVHLLGTYTPPSASNNGILTDALVGWGSRANGGSDTLAIPPGNSSFVWRGHKFPPLLSSVSAPGTKIISVSTFNEEILVVTQAADGKRHLYSWGAAIASSLSSRTPYTGDLSPLFSSEFPIPFDDQIDPERSYTSTGDYRYTSTSVAGNADYTYLMTSNGNITQYGDGAPYEMRDGGNASDTLMCGDPHCGYLNASGILMQWSPGEGQCCWLGQGCTGCSYNPVIFPVPGKVLFAGLGSSWTVAITDDAAQPIYFSGQCGNPDGMCLNIQDQVVGTPKQLSHDLLSAFSGNDVHSMAAGNMHAMVIVNSGSSSRYVIGFGSNIYGQVYSHANSSIAPSVVPAGFYSGFPTSVACVGDTTFLLTTVGTTTLQQKVWVWGFNGVGGLFGPGHDDIIHTRDPAIYTSAVLLMLPLSLGQPYSIASIPSSPTAKSIFAILKMDSSYLPYATWDASNEAEPSRPTTLIGVGTDTPFVYDYMFAPMFMEKQVTVANGEILPQGSSIPASENLIFAAFSATTHWFYTDGNRLYGRGKVDHLPPFLPDGSPQTSSLIVTTPRVFYDGNTDGIHIVQMDTFDISLIYVLSDNTAFFLWSSLSSPGSVYNDYGTYSTQTGQNPGQADPFQFTLRSTYNNVSCNFIGCCLVSLEANTVDCYGPMKTSTSKRSEMELTTRPLWDVTTSITAPTDGATITPYVFPIDGGVLVRISTGAWTSYMDKGAIVDSTGAMPLNAVIQQVAQGLNHRVALIAGLGMYVSGDTTWGKINASAPNWNPWYQNHASTAAGVQQVAAWGQTTTWLSGGTVYFTGRIIQPSENWDSSFNYREGWAFTLNGPLSIPVPGWQITRLFSVHSTPTVSTYGAYQTAWTFTSSMMIMAGTQLAPVTPPSTPNAPSPVASPPPVPVATPCAGTAPFSNCTCVSGTWKCSGRITLDSNTAKVVLSGPTDVEGDLTVSAPGALTVQVTGSTSFTSGRPILNVTGCLNLLSPITVELTDSTVRSIPASTGRTLSLAESSCTQSSNTFITAVQTGRKCKNIATQPQQARTDTGRTTISALFTVTRDSCSYWWIILVGVLGSVIVVAAVMLVVFLKVPAIRKTFQPYRGTNA